MTLHPPPRAVASALDPDLLSRIRSLNLRARLAVEGFLTGLHRSPYHGFSTEFMDHRAYQSTDPPRLVDWRVFGRTDKLYVKRYADETNLRAYLLVDCSASMGYRGSGPMTKMEYARSLAASLALLLLKQRDAVGLCLFDETIRSWVRARTAAGHIDTLLVELQRHEPQGHTRPLDVFTTMAGRLPRRALVVLISDLLVPLDTQVRALRSVASGGHELVVFRILDSTERHLRFPGPVSLRDMETGQEVTTLPSAVGEAYAAAVAQWWQVLCRETERFRAQLVDLDTDDSLVNAFTAFLSARQRLR
ncbi:DUF58 domain-containing protein [Candidatus Fermentibacteria bacterium]|nr:DUF58 domain-containing protein [Candidatus Fermentibacteria bacterium]